MKKLSILLSVALFFFVACNNEEPKIKIDLSKQYVSENKEIQSLLKNIRKDSSSKFSIEENPLFFKATHGYDGEVNELVIEDSITQIHFFVVELGSLVKKTSSLDAFILYPFWEEYTLN